MPVELLLALAALVVLIGLAGTVLPVIPGIPMVFGGLFLAAWAQDFTRVGTLGLSIIAVLTVLGIGVDLLGSLLGAKRAGASPQALFGATAGAIIGFFFGIPGLVFGPFIGAMVGEYIAKREVLRAGKVGIATWLGLLAAAVAKVVIAFLMLATFATFYLVNAAAA